MIDQPIPAVLSIDEGEPGYRSYWQDIAHDLEIFVDGQRQEAVTAYNCDAGTVKRFKRNADGGYIVEGDEVVLETVTGTVEVLRKLK